MATSTTALDDKLHWYKDAIIYELHIKAFKDGNGDGIGDFEGLLQKLDYLEDLGVTAIWVLPFYPSPLRDDGYDIADYYSINPSYGDIDQFKMFLQEAHKRNLKVITELVINHTSDQHPWFQRARKAEKGTPERDYYVWTDNPDQYKDVRIIFQDFETSNWTWDPVAQQYYWHRFFSHQPDLNYDSELVQQEVFKIIDYWCAMGVDGFRLDAVPYLYEREGTNGENLPETHAYLKRLRTHVDEHFPGTVLLAEANMWPEDSASYFGDGDECHMNYHFPVMPRMFMALQMEDRYPITDIFDQTPDIPETCQWAIFLRNHDELTLEMVTDEERDYMYKTYAKDPKAKINLGIRHRLAPLMENNRRKIELMNVLLFSLAGTPVIYYGDEIGMGDNFYLGDRDGVRTPMQWNADRNGGFSTANPQRLYLPLILDPEYSYEAVNVSAQVQNPSSLFWLMKTMISMRKKFKAFSRGNLKFINVENPKVLVFTRTYQEQTILVVVNLSRFAQAAEADLDAFKGSIPVEVYSKNKFPSIKNTPYFFTLGPHACHWFELRASSNKTVEQASLQLLAISNYDNLLTGPTKELLEQSILQEHLEKSRWFSGNGRTIYSIRIDDYFSLPLEPYKAFFLLIEVAYESGLPETYQLPVALVMDGTEQFLNGDTQSVVCRANYNGAEGLLVDALYIPALQHLLFTHLASQQVVQQGKGEITFSAAGEVSTHLENNPTIKARILPVEDTNTSMSFNNCYFLKIYRVVDRSINPDVEITRHLSEVAGFKEVPPYLGAIEWKRKQQIPMVLAMLQPLVEYHGNGRSYMQERMVNYRERIVARTTLPSSDITANLIEPINYDHLPADMQEFIGGTIAEGANLLGVRTGEMHLALEMGKGLIDFKPEDFSLHYQRSLFSGLQSLVRVAFDNLARCLHQLPDEWKEEGAWVLSNRNEILNKFKGIYDRKLDVTRIRIHGNYQLRRILFTGRDIAITDFGGDPTRPYSERRIKRSPLRDVAGMIRSFYYAAYEGLILKPQVTNEESAKLQPYAELWTHHVSGYFLQAYTSTVKGASFIPANKPDLKLLLETFLLEKAVYSLHYELNHRPEYVLVPLRLIKAILSEQTKNKKL